MTPKQLAFGDGARHRLLGGIDLLAEAVKVTLGPRGRTVILDDADGHPRVVNSGVVVARSIELADRFEDMGAQLLRVAASRTSELAGDGTTTATVLAHAMIREGVKHIAAGMNPMELKRGLDRAVDAVAGRLAEEAQACADGAQVAHVATISANNDHVIGDLVARAFDRVGREGAISIEDGSGVASALEVVDGMRLDRGFVSAYFVNDTARRRVVLDDARVLVCDHRLASAQAIVPILEEVARDGAALLLVADDFDEDVVATLVVNGVRGVLKVCAVKAPGFGDARKAALADIALATGATLVSAELGRSMDKIGLEQLGRVRRVTVERDSTTLAGSGGDPPALAARVAALRQERDETEDAHSKRELDQRIGRLTGGVCVIKVGATTERELKERKLRVEDALHATRAAIEEGIVPGGGVALLQGRRVLHELQAGTLEQRAAIAIVDRALQEPLRCIVENAAGDPATVVARIEEARSHAYGWNALTRTYGNLLDMGVIDPVKVTRLALLNAASVAGLVLATDCVITQAPAVAPVEAEALSL